jgi:glycosyltransferase involved in cell wall biosynthesis
VTKDTGRAGLMPAGITARQVGLMVGPGAVIVDRFPGCRWASIEHTGSGNPERSSMRVLVVAENSSMRMGGEACYGVFFFRLLRDRGIDAWLLTHDRVRRELTELFPDDLDRIYFVDDTRFDRDITLPLKFLPAKLHEQTFGVIAQMAVQYRMRRLAKRLVPELRIDLVHQVAPISPKAVSAMYGLGAPVVIGPLSGAMDYPPAFQHMHGALSRLAERFGRAMAHVVNRVCPGKIRAAALIVANPQTRAALPIGYRGVVHEGISEVSVDTRVWRPRSTPVTDRPDRGEVRFVYLGRLVDWKAVDLLLEGFRKALDRSPRPGLFLEILGDGDLRGTLEEQARALNLGDRVHFAGWVDAREATSRMEQADVFVLPSLRESGGIVLMEAMALGLPIITTHWGGPGHHVDDRTGFRIEPTSREGFTDGIADAMIRLARSPELRVEMGRAALERVETGTYTWDHKIDRTLEIYEQTLGRVGVPQA